MTEAIFEVPTEERLLKEVDDPVTKLRAEADSNLEGWKRALADYENLERESARQQAERALWIKAQVVGEILPLLDNLRLAIDHLPAETEKEGWHQGLHHVLAQGEDILKGLEVSAIDVQAGNTFDHSIHEAVDTRQDNSQPDHVILKVITPGYRLNHEVIRPAKVVVNDLTNKKSSDE